MSKFNSENKFPNDVNDFKGDLEINAESIDCPIEKDLDAVSFIERIQVDETNPSSDRDLQDNNEE